MTLVTITTVVYWLNPAGNPGAEESGRHRGGLYRSVRPSGRLGRSQRHRLLYRSSPSALRAPFEVIM